jgi:hypothetical protein
MNTKTHRRTLALLGCAASFAGTALAVVPSAASAAGTCPNKTLAIKPAGNRTLHVPVRAVFAQGLSCAQAYQVMTLAIEGKTPKAWKNVPATFTVPSGLVPQEFKASGGRVIKYGIHGG